MKYEAELVVLCLGVYVICVCAHTCVHKYMREHVCAGQSSKVFFLIPYHFSL